MIWESPVGPLSIVAGHEGLLRIHFEARRRQPPRAPGRVSDEGEAGQPDQAVFERIIRQLDEYFTGRRRTFDVPLAPKGTPFQLAVWRALLQIPYGETRSYAEVARAIGNPTAIRAVGAANGANPIPIIIPCHRVIGSNGSLTGFGGGIALKRHLLDLETQCSLPLR